MYSKTGRAKKFFISDSFAKLKKSKKGKTAAVRIEPEWLSEMTGIFQFLLFLIPSLKSGANNPFQKE